MLEKSEEQREKTVLLQQISTVITISLFSRPHTHIFKIQSYDNNLMTKGCHCSKNLLFSHSVDATFIHFFFHFPSSSSSPFDKPRKAHVCFSLSLWIVSLHHLVSPKWQSRQFYCQFSSAASSEASCIIPSSNLRMSCSSMSNVGVRHVPTCQSHELFGSHSPWQDQRLLHPRGKPTKASIQQRIHFLNFQNEAGRETSASVNCSNFLSEDWNTGKLKIC